MPAYSRILISNLAIAKLPSQPIQSISESSLEARECARYYDHVISTMLQGPHDWSFQNRRVLLAQLANSRPNEWMYAYAAPADMASPIRVIPDIDSLGLGIPIPLAGEPYSEVWATALATIEAEYILEDGVIYTNVEKATLEYGIGTIEEADIPPLVADALASELAYHIAVPVKKDRKLKGELFTEKELAWARAIADDQNRHPQSQSGFGSESMAARQGYLTGWSG